jgi:hypothetical protein
MSDPLKGDGNALANADTHGGERQLLVAHRKFQRGRAGDAGAGHAERMAERDGAAIGVDVPGIFLKPELAQDGDALAGERPR